MGKLKLFLFTAFIFMCVHSKVLPSKKGVYQDIDRATNIALSERPMKLLQQKFSLEDVVFKYNNEKFQQLLRRSKRNSQTSWQTWIITPPYYCIPSGQNSPDCGNGCGYCCKGKCISATNCVC